MFQDIDDFRNTHTEKKKIIVIYGPTGSGKTSMSIDIAKHLDTEIISTDSRQIFRQMNIGTGKITEAEKQGVIHHMLDIITPDEEYSVGEFKQEAEKIIDILHGQGRIPMLVGGTGLYIDSLIYNFEVGGIPADKELRANLEQELTENGSEAVYKKLQLIDPEYAKEIHPNNSQYVIRAIEVKLASGKSKRDFRTEKQLQYDVLFLTPDYGSRENLYSRINARVGQMFDEGLENEVMGLIDKGYKETDFGMKSIGYKEFFPYFRGEYNLETCMNLVRQHSRNYAKRQCTWFRKYEEK